MPVDGGALRQFIGDIDLEDVAGSGLNGRIPGVRDVSPRLGFDAADIQREGRAFSVRRTVGSPSAVGVGVGRREEPGAEAAGPGSLVQAATAPVPARTSPPSRNCRRENAFIMI